MHPALYAPYALQCAFYPIAANVLYCHPFTWIGVAADEEAYGKDWWILIRNASICAPRQLSPISKRNARMARVCYITNNHRQLRNVRKIHSASVLLWIIILNYWCCMGPDKCVKLGRTNTTEEVFWGNQTTEGVADRMTEERLPSEGTHLTSKGQKQKHCLPAN